MRKSARHSPLIRALDLVLELSRLRFGMTLAEMVELLKTSRRNIYRYLDALQRAGVKFRKEKLVGRRRWLWRWRLIDIRGRVLKDRNYVTPPLVRRSA